MLILDDNNEPIIIENVHTPTITDYMWTLDLTMMDFTISPILTFEEITSNSIMLRVLGFDFILPTNWNILIVDEETMAIDIVEIKDVGGKEHLALLYGPDKKMIESAPIFVWDYFVTYVNVAPLLSKHQLLCHPVAPKTWVTVGPLSKGTYNKYLKTQLAGDLL